MYRLRLVLTTFIAGMTMNSAIVRYVHPVLDQSCLLPLIISLMLTSAVVYELFHPEVE